MSKSYSVLAAMAEVYKQYIQGWAYIPLQDLGRYEKAYKDIYMRSKLKIKEE